jgi:predicted nucleic acid-binding protein
MIILDTNVVSEPLRPAPEPRVIAWLDAQPAEALYLTCLTLAELCYGVAALPDGRRRARLAKAIAQVAALHEGRILPFDDAAAQPYAELAVRARAAGRALSLPDAYIAAIAAVHGFAVATRDTAPYEAAGVLVINPWLD